MAIKRRPYIVGLVAVGLLAPGVFRASAGEPEAGGTGELWKHDNMVAWTVVPFDARNRTPEQRAEMLERLGFKHFAYDWRDKDVPTFDAEIEALKKHRIDLTGWWFPLDAGDPRAKETLEVFKRNHVHPQLWVPQSFSSFPKTPEDWDKLLPAGVQMPKTPEEFQKLSAADMAALQEQTHEISIRLMRESLNKTPEEQAACVRQEAERIRALVKLAEPYGSAVELYNHNGWFGMMDNQVAIIERLKQAGVTGVGIVYNFSHARDELHDDSVSFPALWKKIEPFTVEVNITGMRMDGDIIYPSQGNSELTMMRTIQDSGWHGRIGLIAEKGGDAEVTLRNYITGLDWLAAELKRPGSGGPRPFPPVP